MSDAKSRLMWSWGMVALIAACGGDPPPPSPEVIPRWDCPSGWVAYELGGCGPARSLCSAAGGRGAAADADCASALGLPAPGDLAAVVGAPDGPPPPEHEPAMDAVACPSGWTPVEGVACAPSLAVDCAAGSAPLPDGSCTDTNACTRDAAGYPVLPPEAAVLPVLHVREGADPSTADGSALRPFATIAGAIAAVPAGSATALRIADGTYRESVTVDREVTLVGACPAAVGLDTPGPDPAVRVTGTGTRATLRGLRLGGAGIGLLAEAGASATARSLVVRAATRRGVLADGDGAAIDLSESIVEGTLPGGADDGMYGRGVQAWRRGTVRARRVVVQDVTQAGVHAVEGGEVFIEDSTVRRVATIPSGQYGLGLSNTDGRLHADRVAIVDCPVGVQGWGPIDARVVSVQRATSERGGFGVIVGTGGMLQMHGLFVEEVFGGQGVRLQGDAVLRSAVIRRVAPNDVTIGANAGIHVEPGVTAELSSIRIEDTRGYGVVAFGPATDVTIEHLTIDGVASGGSAFGGFAILAGATAQVHVRDARIENAADFGLASSDLAKTGEASLLAIEDSVVLGPGAETAGVGIGITSQDGATARATRVLFERTRRFGAMSLDGGETVLDRSVVRNAVPADSYGYGVVAGPGGRTTLRASHVEATTEVGVAVFGRGTCVIEDSVVRAVAESLLGGGWGVVVQLYGDLTIRRSRFEEMAEVGVVADGGRIVLEDLVVQDVTTGARGYGAGLILIDAQVEASRVALERTASAGVIVTALVPETPLRRNTLTDLWVRGIDAASLQWRPGDPYEPIGLPVAYGIHVVQLEAIVERAVVAEGSHGFYVSDGALSLRHAVLAGHLDAGGAIDRGSYTLDDVRITANARDEVIEASLPVAATLAPPSELCLADPCE